jgi:hypothetical protein
VPDELTPRERLELLRREEAQADRERSAKMSALLRDDLRRTRAEEAGLAAPGDHLPTRAMIEAKRAELRAAGLKHGYRPLAAAFHVSVGVIRRRLGK